MSPGPSRACRVCRRQGRHLRSVPSNLGVLRLQEDLGQQSVGESCPLAGTQPWLQWREHGLWRHIALGSNSSLAISQLGDFVSCLPFL